MNDDGKHELPEWTRLVASGMALVAASAPWTQGWSETGAKVWFSIVVFLLTITLWVTLWLMVEWTNAQDELRKYGLLEEDDG